MKIKIVDDLKPEDIAMVQALYSRSAASADDHLAKAQASGSSNFVSKYVVGYGDRSIADCGTTTIFIEGVSLLAAKAIQDHALYSGQETSTRYIDMANQPIVDPVKLASLDERGASILARWMAFYKTHQDRVAKTVRDRHPMTATDSATPEAIKAYGGAVKARTFDIMRGFLPAGITTQLSWHTNLRQAADHLVHLGNHPSPEIRGIAKGIREALAEKYPSSSFDRELATLSGIANKSKEEAAARAQWEEHMGKSFTYASAFENGGRFGAQWLGSPRRLSDLASSTWNMLKTRPRGCVIPQYLSALGTLSWQFPLDFGSFRDLQRHRNGVCRMPLLTTQLGFEPWYLEQLDSDLRQEARALIESQTSDIESISGNPVVRQYYTALGFRVACDVSYALPAAVYVMEMRSAKTVHPTLRKVVLEQMVPTFRSHFRDLALHVDEAKDDWTVRRGTQTITEKA
jgi:thymidylate synthase ThyX